VLAATNEYRQEQDVLATFLAECTVTDPNVRDTARSLYGAFEVWCKTAGEQPMSQRSFGMRLKEKGFTREKSKREVFWIGLQVASAVDDGRLTPQSEGFFSCAPYIEKNPTLGCISSTATLKNEVKPNKNSDLDEKQPDTLSSTAGGLSSTATGDAELTPEAMAALLAEAERGGVQ